MSAHAPVLAPAADPLRAGTLAGLHEVYADAEAAVYCADAVALARALPDASVDLIAPDLPYYRVKDEEWDRAWTTERAFLLWVRDLCREYRRILKPSGSLYLFSSPQMAHGVERVVRRQFRVLNQIVWRKEQARHKGADTDALRGYFPQTERIVFAEQFGADEYADNQAGYSAACQQVRQGAFGGYLRMEFERAGVGPRAVAGAIGAYGRVNNGGAVSNWVLGYNIPSAEQYTAMRGYLNDLPGAPFLTREYCELAALYQGSRDEIAAGLERFGVHRRAFAPAPGAPYTDVWDFATVAPYPGKHECEKPLPLCEHIVRTSSRPGDVVLDNTCGSGQMGRAALNLGRRVILGDNSLHWARRSADRLAQGALFSALEVA